MKNSKIYTLLTTLFVFGNLGYSQIYTPDGTIQGSSGNNNVGIGVSNPTDKFQIGSNTTFNSSSVSLSGDVRITGYSSGTPYAFIGARDQSGSNSIGVVFRSQYYGRIVNAVHIMPNGDVGIGTSGSTTTEKLTVNGKIKCEEIEVETVAADFVFKDNYHLRSLEEVETFIKDEAVNIRHF